MNTHTLMAIPLQEVYRVELISRKPSASLLYRHDLGPELIRQLSPSPHDSHTLVASVDDGCRLVKVISEGEEEEKEKEEEEDKKGEEEEEGEEEEDEEEKEEEEEGEAGGSKGDDESDGDHDSVMKVEEIGQKPEMGDFPVEKAAGPKGKGNTPTEKEDSVRQERKTKTAQETSAQGGGDDKEEGGTKVEEEKRTILRQRKKADKTDARGEQVKTSKSLMREERFAVEIGEKHQSDFAGGEDALQKVAKFSCDGKLVVTGGVDGCVRVWKVRAREGRGGEGKGREGQV